MVYLAGSELKIKQLSDLKYIGVISFHNTKSLLDPEYHDAVVNNPNYIEIRQQNIKWHLKTLN